MTFLNQATRTLLLLALLLAIAPAARAQPTQESLKESFRERYPTLLRLKTQGKIGETWEGYVAPVEERFENEALVRQTIEAENDDREALYEILARDIREDVNNPEAPTITAEIVAVRNARRNFENARPEEFLRLAEGVWIRGRDKDRWFRLLELREDGLVGETREGYVAAVRPEDARSRAVAAVIERENKWRREYYEKTAEARDVAVERVATEAAEALIRAAGPEVWVQDESGRWVRRAELRIR